MGSKARHAKHILPLILKDSSPDQWYVEPFVEGCNVIDKVHSEKRLGADFNEYLIIMWQAVADGWEPPKLVTEDYYNELKVTKPKIPETGYAGFALSFAGKFFGGYRRDKAGTKGDMDNMRLQSKRSYESMMKQAESLKGVKFVHSTYDALDIPPKSIIYCDPPYADTTKYATGNFDHDAFWKWCDDMVNEGHDVFVSEYSAPIHWQRIWSREISNSLDVTKSATGIESLFQAKRILTY